LSGPEPLSSETLDGAMGYDNADWHSGGDFPKDLPPENGGTHIGMFLAWAILRNLEGDTHQEEFQDELAEVRARRMTGRDFLFKACDGKFWEEDLNEEGNAFAHSYYGAGGKTGKYFDDYREILEGDVAGTYYVADTWDNFDQLAPVIDRRFADWRSSPTPRKKFLGLF
jgi:hypothetical protein